MFDMQINGKVITTNMELLKLMEEGINPIQYIQNEEDLELVCYTICYVENPFDPFWYDEAALLLKAIVCYLLDNKDEIKTLERCKEIVVEGLNTKETLNEMFENNDKSQKYYKYINSAQGKTYRSILEVLIERLEEFVK